MKMYLWVTTFLLSGLIPLLSFAQSSSLQSFSLSSVRLLDGPFQKAQQTDLHYILSLDPERLLAPFRREAGIASGALPYGNWENTGLDGHIGGHYLSALAYMHAATGQPALLQRLNTIIDELERCQQQNGDGYLGGVPGGKAMWQEIARGDVRAESFSLNGKWVPWYNLHKLFAGLRDAYLFTGNEKARQMLIRLSNWCANLVAGLSDAQIQEMLKSEHGGMNEVLADVAHITGDPKYLNLARSFSHQNILKPLLAGRDELNGLHANTQIPKVIGYQRIAEVAGDKDWSEAAAFFWKTVVDRRTVSIGGNSVREHFHPADDFSSMLESKEGPETCNTYNMLRLSRQLYLTKPSEDYIGYYERAMYNHILSSQHPDGGFVYFTPMRPRHYRVYSQPEQGFWCCVGSGLENHGKYGELIYAHQGDDLFVNLFIASQLNWQEKGLRLMQQTRFPYEEKTQLRLQLEKPRKFVLHIRKPQWAKEAGFEVHVNEKTFPAKSTDGSAFVAIERKWKTGDVVSVTLPTQTRAEYLPDGSPWVSFVHGPIVLAAATDTTDLTGLRADGSRMGHIANGPSYPIETAPVLVTTDTNLVAHLRPVPGEALSFQLTDLIQPSPFQQVKLVPFFGIHDARYMVYWPVSTPEQLKVRQQALKEKEKEMAALEARTVDQVAPGEQQPESDHAYASEGSESGVHRDRHWRHAKGWFSYELKDPRQEARQLQVTYYGLDKDRHFDIYVNDVLLTTVHSDGSQGDQFFDVSYPLPEKVRKSAAKDILKVKFQAYPNSVAGGVFGVRLLK
jgi:uncharacterized protein